MKSLPVIATAIAALCVIPCAEAQTVNFTAGTQFNTGGLATSTTRGGDMSGMLVTWTFVDGSVESGTWKGGGPTYHGVLAGRFQVYMLSNGNTYSNSFYVVNETGLGLASIRFNGAPGRTVFDCDWNGTACGGPGKSFGFNGSAGSATGATAKTTTTSNYLALGVNPTFTYSNLVGIGGAAPVGDLFEQLLIEFSGRGLGPCWNCYGSGSRYYDFIADTDNSDLTLPPPAAAAISTVPEPGTYALLAAGLAVLAGVKRRRRISA
jgi:hypothetical protein